MVCGLWNDARNKRIDIIKWIEFNGARLGCNFEKRTLMYHTYREKYLWVYLLFGGFKCIWINFRTRKNILNARNSSQIPWTGHFAELFKNILKAILKQ